MLGRRLALTSALALCLPLLVATRGAEASEPVPGTGWATCATDVGDPSWVTLQGTFLTGGEPWYVEDDLLLEELHDDGSGSGVVRIHSSDGGFALYKNPALDPERLVEVDAANSGGRWSGSLELYTLRMELDLQGTAYDWPSHNNPEPVAFSMKIDCALSNGSYTQWEGGAPVDPETLADPEDGSGAIPYAAAAPDNTWGFEVITLVLDGTFRFDGDLYTLGQIGNCENGGVYGCLKGLVTQSSEITGTDDLREECGENCDWLADALDDLRSDEQAWRFGVFNEGTLNQVRLGGTVVRLDPPSTSVGSVVVQAGSGAGTWSSVQYHNRDTIGTWSTAAWQAAFTANATVCLPPSPCSTKPVTFEIKAAQAPQGAAAFLPHTVGTYTQEEAS